MKKMHSLNQLVLIFFFASMFVSCDSYDEDKVKINTLKEGIYDITYSPANGQPYSEAIYMKQDGDVISGEICSGFKYNEVWDKPSLYGYADGNDVLIKGGGISIENVVDGDISHTQGLFSFWVEVFDFLIPENTTDFGPAEYYGNTIAFNNSFLGCNTKNYFNGCDFQLHIYGGSITVDTLVPVVSGSFTGNVLYQAHFSDSYDPLPGEITGTFNVPFDGSLGTFTATGTIDEMPMSIDVTNAYFYSHYRFDVTINNNGLFSGIYDLPGMNEQGTVASTFVSNRTDCP